MRRFYAPYTLSQGLQGAQSMCIKIYSVVFTSIILHKLKLIERALVHSKARGLTAILSNQLEMVEECYN